MSLFSARLRVIAQFFVVTSINIGIWLFLLVSPCLLFIVDEVNALNFVFEEGQWQAITGSEGSDFFHVKNGAVLDAEPYWLLPTLHYSINSGGGNKHFLIEGGYFTGSILCLEADSVKMDIKGGEFVQAVQGSFGPDVFRVSGGIFHRGILGNGGGDRLYLDGPIFTDAIADMELIRLGAGSSVRFPESDFGMIILESTSIVNNGGALILRIDFYNGTGDTVFLFGTTPEGDPLLKIEPVSAPNPELPALRIPVAFASPGNLGLIDGPLHIGPHIYDLLLGYEPDSWDLALVGRIPLEAAYSSAMTMARQQTVGLVSDFMGHVGLLERRTTAFASKTSAGALNKKRDKKSSSGKTGAFGKNEYWFGRSNSSLPEFPKKGRVWTSASITTSNTSRQSNVMSGYEILYSEGWYGETYLGFMAIPNLKFSYTFPDGRRNDGNGSMLFSYFIWDWSPASLQRRPIDETWEISLTLSSFKGELEHRTDEGEFGKTRQWSGKMSGVSGNMSFSLPLSLFSASVPSLSKVRVVPELGGSWYFSAPVALEYPDKSRLEISAEESRMLRLALGAAGEIESFPWLSFNLSYAYLKELARTPGRAALDYSNLESAPLGDMHKLSLGGNLELTKNLLPKNLLPGNLQISGTISALSGGQHGYQADLKILFTW